MPQDHYETGRTLTLLLLGFPFALLWITAAVISWAADRQEKRAANELKRDLHAVREINHIRQSEG